MEENIITGQIVYGWKKDEIVIGIVKVIIKKLRRNSADMHESVFWDFNLDYFDDCGDLVNDDFQYVFGDKKSLKDHLSKRIDETIEDLKVNEGETKKALNKHYGRED